MEMIFEKIEITPDPEEVKLFAVKSDIIKIRENNETGEIILKFVHGKLKQHYYTKSTLHND